MEKIVLFVYISGQYGREQVSFYSVPWVQYRALRKHQYLEDGRPAPVSGHAVAFDGEDLRGVFRITVAYPGSGHVILPELGNKKTLGELDDTVNGYRVNIVSEPELQKISLDAIPVEFLMYPRPIFEVSPT